MTVTSNLCEFCESVDNLKIWDNGSSHCFTTDCEYNKQKGHFVNDTPAELEQGQYAPLAGRRISQRTCEFFSYQVSLENNKPCQIANYRDNTGKVVAQKIRYEGKQFAWKGGPNKAQLFGQHLWSNKSNNIIITEGEIDALSIAEAQDCKWPVVSIPNGAQSAVKSITAQLEWLNGFKEVILCFDMDEAGELATEAVATLFAPGKVRIANLSRKDANEVLVAGGINELTKLVWNATEYRPDGIVDTFDMDLDDIFKEEPKALSSPYPILDEMIRGFGTSRIYMIYAGTGNGKSSIMKEMLKSFRENYPDTPIAAMFLEEGYKKTLKSLIALDNNLPAYKVSEHPELISADKRIASKNKFSDVGNKLFLYNHFGSLETKRLFGILEYFAVGKGAKIIFLDHISLLISGLEDQGLDERKALDRIMTNLRQFAERTDTCVIVATQLKRQEKAYGEGADITESSARGSGAIEHLSDVVFALNRNKKSENPNQVQLQVIKNRVSGMIGDADLIEYNLATGRYLPKKKVDLKIFGQDQIKNSKDGTKYLVEDGGKTYTEIPNDDDLLEDMI